MERLYLLNSGLVVKLWAGCGIERLWLLNTGLVVEQ